MKIVGYNEEKRTEVAKIIKNTFSIGLSDVMDKLDKMPSVLSRENSLKKSKKIAKELQKIGIITEIQKVSVEGDTGVSQTL